MIIRKTFSRLLLMILGACGLAGCDTLSPSPPEYACPYADYTFSGTVVDADSSKAIEGIKIRFGTGTATANTLTAYSDADGTWQMSGRLWCVFRDSLYVADIDGDANRGTFLPDTLALQPTRRKPVLPHDEWYLGSFEQTDVVITMKKTP